MKRAALVALALLPSLALAAPPRLAICPPHDTGLGAAGARIDAALADAAQALPGFTVANLAAGKLSGPRRGDARLETQPAARARAFGKELGATRAVVVEATPLGDGLIVYLQALEVPSGRAVGSTTLSFGGGAARAPGDRDAMRAALMRILDPGRYTGRLQVRVDVQGAVVQVDGRPTPAAGPIELSVGTHALRVTHPAYHDFLRFLDIEFDKTVAVDVNLAAYPLAEGEMTERQRRGQPVAHRRVAWWRSWWALTLAGVALTGVTVGAVWLARPWLQHGDSSTPYNPMPQP
ncbi:MAG TPA: PEGA domain-containing protein [Polyangia bacterium]